MDTVVHVLTTESMSVTRLRRKDMKLVQMDENKTTKHTLAMGYMSAEL